MTSIVQTVIACWLVVLLVGGVLPAQLRDRDISFARQIAANEARIATAEQAIQELKGMKIGERLAAIEATQQTNQYLLVALVLGILSLLVRDIGSWIFRNGRKWDREPRR